MIDEEVEDVEDDENDDWEVATVIEVGVEELDEDDGVEEEGIVVVLDVGTSCCDKAGAEEGLRRVRLVPLTAVSMEYQYSRSLHVYIGIQHTQWLSMSGAI